MEKISQEKVAQLFKDAAETIRTLVAERDTAVTKLAQIERGSAIDKLASEIEKKGLGNGASHSDLVANLEKMAEQGKLEMVREAVGFVGPDMGEKLASINNNDENRSGGGSSALEQFILSD